MAKFKVFTVSEPSLDNLASFNVAFPSGDFQGRVNLLDQDGNAKEAHYFYGFLTVEEQAAIRTILAPYLPVPKAEEYVEISVETLASIKPVKVVEKVASVVEPIEEI
jgi:hypothetical protein